VSFWQYVKESKCKAHERNQIQKGAGKRFVGGTHWQGRRQQFNPGSCQETEVGGLGGTDSGFGLFFPALH